MNSPMDRLHSKFRRAAKYSAARRNEVYHHFDKGRDIGSIAVWVNLPVSVIAKILSERPVVP